MRPGNLAQATLAAFVLCLGVAVRAQAQTGGGIADIVRRGWIHGHARPPAGFYAYVASHPDAFEFKTGWLERAAQVRRNRAALRSRGAYDLMNAQSRVAAASPQTATAVSGTLRYPTFMVFFSNTTMSDSALMDSATVQNKFWATTTAPPYSVTTYYKEISHGLLTVTGNVILHGIRLTQRDTFYAGPPEYGQPCQGICDSSRVPQLIVEMLTRAESLGVDFSSYADPATGKVPGIVILDPQVGGECYQVYAPADSSIWAHRYSLSDWQQAQRGGPGAYVTKSTINGHAVVIDDYIIQGGQGGNDGCTPGQLAPIGTVTHETGHLFGLPDLYDTDPNFLTEGLGHWDLMSSGNEQLPFRPAHMSAWSLSFMGWISEVPVTTSQTITTGPIEVSDTAFIVPMAGTPDHEFFLLENRQPIGSDSMMAGPGLMIYHTDTVLIDERSLLNGNSVNAIQPHGIWILEAAGDTGLDCTYGTPAGNRCNDRGDAGDPYPGDSNNTSLGPTTHPASVTNAGAFSGAIIDSIRQVAPFGAMTFRVTFGPFLVKFLVTGTGAVTPSPAVDPTNGTTFSVGDTVTLTAVAGAGQSFLGWSGDTTSGSPVLRLVVLHPFTVTANFAAPSDVVNQLLTGSGPIAPAALLALDKLGNNNGRFDIGDLVAWLDRNPGLATSPVMLKLLRGLHQ